MVKCYDVEFSLGPVLIGVSFDLKACLIFIIEKLSLESVLSIFRGGDFVGESSKPGSFVCLHRSVILYD